MYMYIGTATNLLEVMTELYVVINKCAGYLLTAAEVSLVSNCERELARLVLPTDYSIFESVVLLQLRL